MKKILLLIITIAGLATEGHCQSKLLSLEKLKEKPLLLLNADTYDFENNKFHSEPNNKKVYRIELDYISASGGPWMSSGNMDEYYNIKRLIPFSAEDFPNLQELTVKACKYTIDSTIGEFTNLQILYISSGSWNDYEVCASILNKEFPKSFWNLKNLKCLTLDFKEEYGEVERFSELENLESLTISGIMFAPLTLMKLKKLKRLNLYLMTVLASNIDSYFLYPIIDTVTTHCCLNIRENNTRFERFGRGSQYVWNAHSYDTSVSINYLPLTKKREYENGLVKQLYSNGQVAIEGEIKEQQPNGIWKFYDLEGNLTKRMQYNMGVRCGEWYVKYLGDTYFYYENNRIIAKGGKANNYEWLNLLNEHNKTKKSYEIQYLEGEPISLEIHDDNGNLIKMIKSEDEGFKDYYNEYLQIKENLKCN